MPLFEITNPHEEFKTKVNASNSDEALGLGTEIFREVTGKTLSPTEIDNFKSKLLLTSYTERTL